VPTYVPIRDLNDEFQPLEYTGDRDSALFLDGELICEASYGRRTFLVYDLDLGRTINVGNEL